MTLTFNHNKSKDFDKKVKNRFGNFSCLHWLFTEPSAEPAVNFGVIHKRRTQGRGEGG